jgi:hypothetical protein
MAALATLIICVSLPSFAGQALRTAQPLRHAHQFRERAGAHLLHDPRPVDLDGSFEDAELRRGLLVEEATHDEREHLAFTLGERGHAGTQHTLLRLPGAAFAILIEGGANRGEQGLVRDGLLQEVDRTPLHGADASLNVGPAADEDDGHLEPVLQQQVLEVETAQARHAKVDDQARGVVRGVIRREEVLGGPEADDLESLASEKPAQGGSNRGFVVDDVYDLRPAVSPKAAPWRGQAILITGRIVTFAARNEED